MFVRKPPIIALVACASLLAAGCCCPRLSGRYHEVGCRPPCRGAAPTVGSARIADNQPGPCGRGPIKGGHSHGAWHGLLARAGRAPSQQGPDYSSPQPKFHPAPTWPVFEPQITYAPVHLIEPVA